MFILLVNREVEAAGAADGADAAIRSCRSCPGAVGAVRSCPAAVQSCSTAVDSRIHSGPKFKFRAADGADLEGDDAIEAVGAVPGCRSCLVAVGAVLELADALEIHRFPNRKSKKSDLVADPRGASGLHGVEDHLGAPPLRCGALEVITNHPSQTLIYNSRLTLYREKRKSFFELGSRSSEQVYS